MMKFVTKTALTSLMILSLLSGIVFSGTAQAAVVPKVAVVYGDSITYESGKLIYGKFLANATWKTSQVRAWPGSAVCDWQQQLSTDMATLHPQVVTLEMQGNAFTPCMLDSNGNYLTGQAKFDKYQADVDLFIRTATQTSTGAPSGTKVVLLKTLPSAASDDQTLNNMFLYEAHLYHGVSVSPATRNALTNSGKFTWTKTCLSTETAAKGCVITTNPTTGKITSKLIKVRNPDGLHLCPVGSYSLDGCSVYSSGEYRFAAAAYTTSINPPAPILP